MIKQALYDFLTSDDDSSLEATRATARDTVRRLVGSDIYDNRRPSTAGDAAITLSRTSGPVMLGVAGPILCYEPIIDFTIWTRKQDTLETLINALRTLLHQYRGALNADFKALGVFLEAEPFERPTAPIDGSDQWQYRVTCPYKIAHIAT